MKAANELVIVGVGGFGREVLALIASTESHIPVGWLDDAPNMHGANINGLEVLGGTDWIRDNPDVWVAIAIGNPQVRRTIASTMESFGHRRFATLIHPSAWIGPGVGLGQGTIICAGSTLTTDLTLGGFVIVNLGCTIGHDTNIGDFATLAPGVHISGEVSLGEGVDMGTGSVVIQGITVGEESTIGAGAVVIRDLPPRITAVGMPAKPLIRK